MAAHNQPLLHPPATYLGDNNVLSPASQQPCSATIKCGVAHPSSFVRIKIFSEHLVAAMAFSRSGRWQIHPLQAHQQTILRIAVHQQAFPYSSDQEPISLSSTQKPTMTANGQPAIITPGPTSPFRNLSIQASPFQYTAGAPKIRCSIFPKEPPWKMGFFLPTGLHQQSSNPRSSCVPTQVVQRLNPFQWATNDHIHQAAYPIQIWAAAWPILVRSNSPSSSPLNRSNQADQHRKVQQQPTLHRPQRVRDPSTPVAHLRSELIFFGQPSLIHHHPVTTPRQLWSPRSDRQAASETQLGQQPIRSNSPPINSPAGRWPPAPSNGSTGQSGHTQQPRSEI
ncbi:hypothetical protein ACLOJK_034432 [Asimina triloba]